MKELFFDIINPWMIFALISLSVGQFPDSLFLCWALGTQGCRGPALSWGLRVPHKKKTHAQRRTLEFPKAKVISGGGSWDRRKGSFSSQRRRGQEGSSEAEGLFQAAGREPGELI